MKRTKSMIYKPSDEARELFLFAVNTGDLYRRSITPAIANLRRKAVKGTYDREKAADLVDLWNTSYKANGTYLFDSPRF